MKTQKDMMEICMSAQVCWMLWTIRTKLLRERRLCHALRKGDRSPSDEVSVTSARFCCRQHQLTCFTCCQSVQSHIWPHAPAWLKSRSTLSALRPKTFTPHPHRAMSYTLQNLTPRTGTPSPPFPESVLQRAEQPCEDQRPQQCGALTELPPFTDYEPNWLAEAGDYRHFTRDGQFTQHEDLDTPATRFILTRTVVAQLARSAQSKSPHARLKVQGLCAHEKSSTILWASILLKHGTRSTCTPSSRSSLILALRLAVTSLTAKIHYVLKERDSSPELPPAGYEPNWIVDNQIVDDQENVSFTGIEDRVRPLSFHQSIIAPINVSAGSIATPPESDFDDEQFRALLASPTVPTGARSKCRTITSLSLCKRMLDVLFISRSEACRYRETCRSVFKSGWGETHFPRESHLLMMFFGTIEPIFRFSNPTNVAKSLLDGNRDHLLTQARSKQMKLEHKVEPLTIALMSYSGELVLNDWDCSTPITDI